MSIDKAESFFVTAPKRLLVFITETMSERHTQYLIIMVPTNGRHVAVENRFYPQVLNRFKKEIANACTFTTIGNIFRESDDSAYP